MLFKCSTTNCTKLSKLKCFHELPKSARAYNSLSNINLRANQLKTTSQNYAQAQICATQQNRELSFNLFTKLLSKIFPKMNDPKWLGVFGGEADRFKGITVDSLAEYEANVNFEEKLIKSLDYWQKNKQRTIWFKVRSEHADWIPVLTKHDFDFHYAGPGFATLRLWLPKDESSNLPDYAHSLIGVGGLVINHEKMEVLVVTDRYAAIPGSWKLPGGYVDPKENIIDAAKREVLEETGIEVDFRTAVSLRHSHGGNFGCSDLYFVIAFVAKTFELKPCEREIARVRWMKIGEYLKHPNVHETNRHTMRTYLDYERRGLRLDCTTATHQILKKEYQLYFTRAIDDSEKIQVPSDEELDKAIVSVKD